MIRLIALLLFATSSTAGAVVIRDDVNDSEYRVAESEFPALADLPGEGHGVLIAPQWVITAAHAISWQMSVDDITINGMARAVDRVVLHTGYKKLPQEMVTRALGTGDASEVIAFLENSDDIALIRLVEPVTDVVPAEIYRDRAELGKIVKIIGRGATGTGTLGHDPAGPNRAELRRAFNEINGVNDRWLGYAFDSPPSALALEGVSGNGDSGGPVLIKVNDQWQVAGLTSWKRGQGNAVIFRPGMYDQVSKNVRLSYYRDWIASVLGGASSPALVQQYYATFDSLDRTVREHFYDPHFSGHDWNTISARFRERLADVKSDADFQRLGQEMLEELGVSHVAFQLPSKSGPTMGLAALWETIDNNRVITDIDPASGARAAGLRVGDLILNPDAIRGPRDRPALLDVERCDGSHIRLSVPRESAYWPPRERTISWSTLRRGDGRSVGYIRADRFGDDAAGLIDAAMNSVGETDGLLIDVRNNSGGNASALRLLAYFTQPGPAFALLSRPFLETLDGPVKSDDLTAIHRVTGAYKTKAIFDAVREGEGAVMLMIEDIGERRYKKPVVILIGPETESAAEGFAWGAKEQSEAVLVGRPTAGVLLSSERFDLPGGWRVTLPVHGNWGPDGRDFRDQPVPPDVDTIRTRKMICRGEDTDLVAGVRALERAW